MKKINKSILKTYPPVKLYREEMEVLLDLLRDEGFNNLSIQTMDCEFSIEEFFKLEHETIHSLEIKAYDPFYFSINFSDNGVGIYTNINNTQALGLLCKIERLLKSNKRVLLSYFVSNWAGPVVSPLIASGLIVLLIKIDKTGIVKSGLLPIYFLLFIFVFIPSIFLKIKNIIIKDYKKNYPGFWRRNKDQIIVNAIFAIIGFFLGYLTKYL